MQYTVYRDSFCPIINHIQDTPLSVANAKFIVAPN